MRGSEAPKRARTSKSHSADHNCSDANCSCCGDGPVQLDEHILNQPAHTLLSMALEEAESSTHDRAVVIKLFETALEKFGDERSLEHAWALLRFAEYAEYMEYADKAVLLARELGTSCDLVKAQCGLLESRAKILSVCLEQSNWRDPAADDGDSDDEVDAEATGKPVVGESKLVDSLLKLIALHSTERNAETYRSTLIFLFARREAHALTSRTLLILFDAAVTIVYEHEGWLAAGSSGKATAPTKDDNIRRIAHQAALVWAMAAAECCVDSDAIESRLEPIVAYLASQSNDAECCKLYAQLLLVLCGCYADEEKAMNAYDLATSTLVQAHKLSPDDQEIRSQLADMGQPVD
ncbi:hypothetical protein GGI20_003541 [Coemansia sp. BCRC 34301]|nr:hypothetical protein GGI20_003541 [Coemansia sp. BCRC 34301]